MKRPGPKAPNRTGHARPEAKRPAPVAAAPQPLGDRIRRILLLLALGLGIAAAVSYAHWPALSAKAVSFDDNYYLTQNPLMERPGWPAAKQFLAEVMAPSTVPGYYQPLNMISIMLDCTAGGSPSNLYPFHRTSLILHVANTLLLMLLLYLLFGQPWPAALVAMLYGLHPLTVEPIPWVGERKTLLATVFALGALICYVQYARRTRAWGWFAGVVVLYVLAVLSKPTSVPLPVLLLLLDVWPLRRLRVWPVREMSWRVLLEKVPLFVLAAVSAYITFKSQANTAGVRMPGQQHLPTALVLAHNTIFYFWKMLWPANLTSHYPTPQPFNFTQPAVLVGVLGSLALIAALLVSLRKTPAALVGFLFFFIAILPTMGIIGFTDVLTSDKYAYLPAIGLMIALAGGIVYLWTRGAQSLRRRAIVVAVLLAIAAAETVGTRRTLANWSDTVTHYKYMLEFAPDSASMHNNLGNDYLLANNFDGAIKEFADAVRLRPEEGGYHSNYGLALAMRGRIDEAIERYKQGLAIAPNMQVTWLCFGDALLQKGRVDEAIAAFEQALKLKPDDTDAQQRLAAAKAQKSPNVIQLKVN